MKITLDHDGVTYIAELARIDSTFLGYEDHGIFTAQLNLSVGSGGQSTPGYAIEKGAAPVWFLTEIMRAVGVSQWEHLKGLRTLALYADDRFGPIVGLANLDKATEVFIFDGWADRS